MNFNYFLNREGGQVEVIVTGVYYPFHNGHRDSLGVPEEPNEPAFFEIDDVMDMLDYPIELTDDELEAVSEYGVNLVEHEFAQADAEAT